MSVFIDAAILITLFASIGYSIHISRKVARLMDCLKQIEPAFTEFAHAVDRSEASVVNLSKATESLLTTQNSTKLAATANGGQAQTWGEGLPSAFPGRSKSDIVRGFFEVAREKGTIG